MEKLKSNKFSFFSFLFLIVSLYFYQKLCSSIVLVDYLKHYFLEFGRLEKTLYQVQFVNEISQNKYCYFTIQDKYFDIYENKILYFTYFPRTARIFFNQIGILYLTFLLLVDRNRIISNLKLIKFHDLIVFLFGLYLSIWLINRTIFNFENNLMLNIFIIFSLFKFLILYLYLKSNKFHIHILILAIFPLISTGFGFPWMYDFLIYYVLISALKIINIKQNRLLILILFVLISSLIFPLISSPSIEQQIIDGTIVPDQTTEFGLIVAQKNTYLEMKDLKYLYESEIYKDKIKINDEVSALARNLKDIQFPGRSKFLVGNFPDFSHNLPAFFWYLSLFILFQNIINFTNSKTIKELLRYFEEISKILIFYQIFSLFLGINTFFNSFSEFLFGLNRNSEIITFGTNQTWRGISDHYELFSNLQLISFGFYLLTYFVSKKNIYLFFSMMSILTVFLSQSRWTTLIIFLFLFFLFTNLYKIYFKQIILLLVFSTLIVQFIPVFDRDEPFFLYKDGNQTINNPDYSLGVVDPLANRLNRADPWKMFVSGFKPSQTSLIFGHGPASYLNIVKNSETEVTSGPHSSLLLILNKFGLIGIGAVFLIIFVFLKESFRKLSYRDSINLFIAFSILLSLELKTDTLYLMDGVAVFLFNLFLIKLIAKSLIEKQRFN